MRGTQVYVDGFAVDGGIIPAYAGNTKKLILISQNTGDHPRVCGEHRIRPCLDSVTWGSSPRMRGTLEPYFT